MGDGSNMGVDADRALKTILGGEPQPAAEERQSKDQVRERIKGAYAGSRGTRDWPGYGQAADIVAGAVLAFLEDNPEAKEWPIEREYKRDPETGRYTDPMEAVGPDLYGTVKAFAHQDARKIMEDITGFQWGWAANTARWCFDLPEQPNPAIMTIGGSGD